MLLIILVVCYFVPTVVAFSRKHHNAGAICALNVFLGWTVVGKRRGNQIWNSAVAEAGWLCPGHHIDGVNRKVLACFCTSIGSRRPCRKRANETRCGTCTHSLLTEVG